jgi:RimJ/RimL family protein N-acetyltransferase
MKITFRKATVKDSPQIQKWWQDGHVMAPVGFPKGLQVSLEEINQSLQYYEESSGEFLLIIDEQGNAIGEFAYKLIDAEVATFDVKIGECSKQRQGYGEMAVKAGIEKIASFNKLKKIEINVSHTNEPALKLYEKVGFKKIGFLKDNWQNQLGESYSTVVMEYVF